MSADNLPPRPYKQVNWAKFDLQNDKTSQLASKKVSYSYIGHKCSKISWSKEILIPDLYVLAVGINAHAQGVIHRSHLRDNLRPPLRSQLTCYTFYRPVICEQVFTLTWGEEESGDGRGPSSFNLWVAPRGQSPISHLPLIIPDNKTA